MRSGRTLPDVDVPKFNPDSRHILYAHQSQDGLGYYSGSAATQTRVINLTWDITCERMRVQT